MEGFRGMSKCCYVKPSFIFIRNITMLMQSSEKIIDLRERERDTFSHGQKRGPKRGICKDLKEDDGEGLEGISAEALLLLLK